MAPAAAAAAVALVVGVAAVELPPVAAAAAAADESVTPVVAAASETAQRFAAGHVAAVHVAAVHAAAVQKSAAAEVAVGNAVALVVGATVAADTASDLAQLHRSHSDGGALQAAAHQMGTLQAAAHQLGALQAAAHQMGALQAAAHQMGSAAVGIAAEHTLLPVQRVRLHCEGQRRGLEGGKTGAEQELPVDGRKRAGRSGEQGGLGVMKGGSGGPAHGAVRDRHERDLAELAQRIETDSCSYTNHEFVTLSKHWMARTTTL